MMLSRITFCCLHYLERTAFINRNHTLAKPAFSACEFHVVLPVWRELVWKPFVKSSKLADCNKAIESLFHFKDLTGRLKEAVEKMRWGGGELGGGGWGLPLTLGV